MSKEKKPPPPPVYELKVRRCVGQYEKWSLVWLLQVNGAARECRMSSYVFNDVADELAAWFAAHGVAVVREDQPGECEAPGDLFNQPEAAK